MCTPAHSSSSCSSNVHFVSQWNESITQLILHFTVSVYLHDRSWIYWKTTNSEDTPESVVSLTLQKMDKAFESLEQCLLEVITISDSSRKHLFGNKDSSADQYSFTSLAKSGGKSHLTLH